MLKNNFVSPSCLEWSRNWPTESTIDPPFLGRGESLGHLLLTPVYPMEKSNSMNGPLSFNIAIPN